MARRVKTLDETVLAVLASAEVDGLAVRLTCGRLDRKTYLAVNEALESIGGKWNRRAGAHLFEADPRAHLETIVLTGTIQPPQAFDFFPTPPELAARVIELADLRPGMIVIEPSAGDGALADPIAEIVGIEHVPVCEIRDDLADVLERKGYNVWRGDFLEYTIDDWGPQERFVMNPPFSRQQDCDHVLHAWSLLGPGGRLVAIMSAGVTFRTDRKVAAVRELVARYGHIEPNPEGAFKASGTNVRTVTVVLDKAA